MPWHIGFLRMLPTIERYARIAFCGLRGEAREDAVCEVIANCVCAYRRLHERNAVHRAFPSVLVRYAVAQFHQGRRVGTPMCSRDIYQRAVAHPIGDTHWMESLIENDRTPVPDQVHFRVEFPRWLKFQSRRNRRITKKLSLGCSTAEVAREFNISAARVSQIRRELEASWTEKFA